MAIWAMSEDKTAPEHGFRQILNKNEIYKNHWRQTLSHQTHFVAKDSAAFDRLILSRERFSSFLNLNLKNGQPS